VADDVNAVIGVQVDTDQATAQLRALQGQIQQFTRGMAKSSGTAAKAQRDFEKDLISNINASKKWTASFRTMADSTSQFANALDKNKLSMGEYFKYGLGATRTFGKAFDKEMRTVNSLAERRVKSLQTQYIQLGKDAQGMMRTIAITPNNLDFSKYGTQMAMVGQRQQIFNDLVKKGSTELINFGKNTQWAGRQLMVGFTLPLAAFGSLAAKTFMEIEKAAIKFQKVYGDSFTTSEQTDKALKGIEDLALSYTKYGIAVKDTIDLAADLAAAGYEGLRLNEAVIQTQRLAVLGEIDQQTAMKTTISLQNAFQISSKELGNTINFLNAVENQTVVSLQDLTAAIPRVAPVIKGLGGDVQDLAVFLAAMEEGGISAEQGANALKSGLASLINPSKAASEMLGGLGINIQSIIDTNKGDLMGIVSSFGEALATLEDFQRQQVLEKLFGKYQYARLGALFNNIVKDGSQANRAMQLATSSAIELAYTANKELKAVEDATSNRFVKAIEDIKAAMAPIGKIFLQIVTPVIEFGTRALEAFNGLDEGVKRVIAGIVAVVAGVGPVLLMTVGLVANGIGNFIKFINLIRNAFLKMTGQYKGVAGGSQILTEAQLQGVAAADSLAAAEGRVTKSLLVQRDAVLGLASAYAQTLSGARGGMGFLGATQGKPRGYNSGVVSVPGSGNRDTVPAMLTPGEAVIPAEMAKKYAPLINAMVSGQIPGYSEGLGIKSGTQFAHVNDTVEMSLLDFTRRLEEAGVQLSQGVQRWLDDARKIAQGQGGASPQDLKIRVGSGLGFSQDPALNRGMRDGGRVSVDDFVADFKSEGPEKWSQSMKNVGQSFSEVEKDLAIYDAAILDGIESWKRQTGAIDISTEEFSKIESAVRKDVLAPTSKLKIALDTAASQVHDLRFNVNQDVVKSQGFDLADVESKKTPGKISATKKIVGTMLRTGGNRKSGTNRMFQGLTFQDVGLTAEGIVDEAAAKTAKAQKSASPAERSAELGDDWAKGYAQGIDRSASQAAKASGEMVEETFKITDKRSSAMIGSLPANPQSAQAAIDAQNASQQAGKKGIGNRLAGFALRKMKIDQDSLDATTKQTQAIDGETRARRTSMEGFKTLNGRLMAGSIAVDSVAIGMSMMGGEVGEIGQKLLKMSSMVTMASMVLPLLTSPIGLLIAAVAGVAAVYMTHNAVIKASTEAMRNAAEAQAEAMHGSAKAMSEFAKATGAESMQNRRAQRNLTTEQATIFFQALTGPEMQSTLASYRASEQRGAAANMVANDLVGMAINFNMTPQDVESYTQAVATAVENMALVGEIRAELIEMIYEDGQTKKDLLKDPTIPIDIVAEIKKGGPGAESSMLTRRAIAPVANNQINNLMMEQRKLIQEGSTAISGVRAGSGGLAGQEINMRQAAQAEQFVQNIQKSSGWAQTGKVFAESLSASFSSQASANTKALQASGGVKDNSVANFFASGGGGVSGDWDDASIAASKYRSVLASVNSVSTIISRSAELNQLALESLNYEYETTTMSLEEYRVKQEEISQTSRTLQDQLMQQYDLLNQADPTGGMAADFASAQSEIIQIRIDASNLPDQIKERMKEFFGKFANDPELSLKASMAFQTSGLDGTQFLELMTGIEGHFPGDQDKELRLDIAARMTEDNIDLSKLDQYTLALKNMPKDVRSQFLLDGKITEAAAYALAAAELGADSPSLREGLITPARIMERAQAFLKYTPTKTPSPGTNNGTNEADDTSKGSGGKKKKDTWVQKRQKEWSAVQAKIKLEEAEIDASYTKNFSDNLNSNLRSAGLLNSNGQLIINLPGAALNLGNITSQESLDAVRKKIELNLLNLEEKKIPHEKKIKALNKEISANNRIQELNKRKIDQINKSYENQSKALEQVSKIQDYMNRQRQAQTSLAEALSGGDLAAAVKAAQAAQAEQSKFILDNQKDTLDAQREASTFAYEEQNRLIDELNQSLQDQIYNEERVLEGIQDQVDAYNEVTSAIDRAVKKMELLRDITKSAIVVQGPGGGLVTSSQAAANADIFGAADAVLGDKGTKKNYYKSLDQAGYDQQILAGASAQLAALNAAKDAFNVSLKSDSLNALTQSIIDGLRQATFNVSGLSAVGTSGITATSTSNVYNSTSAPVYNININVSGSNASPQDIASAVNQTIRSYNY
jgi:TP901 family phage tail tape measure protein